MQSQLIAAGLGALLLLGACAAENSGKLDVAPSTAAAKALDESKYYAPSETPKGTEAAMPTAGPGTPTPSAGKDAEPAVEHVAMESSAAPDSARPLVPAFPAKMEQQRLRDLNTVYFSYDQAELTDDARAQLKTNANWLKAHPNTRVRVEGHCDERGTNEYNLGLGSRRATQVRDYLVQLGVPVTALDPVSFGEEMPLKTGHDESAWHWNRRVEFSPAAAGARPTANR